MTGRAALALTLALTGCMANVGEGDDLTDTGFVSPIAPHILANGMRQNDVLANSVVAKVETLKALIDNPLRTETFEPGTGPAELTSLPPSLQNQVFIRHLVECALDAKDHVKFHGFQYQGAMGLAPKWFTNKPKEEELELVSGCMLAFVNIDGQHVHLNPRGETIDGRPLSIDGFVRAYAYLPDDVATPLPSFFDTCSPFEIGSNRDCEWVEADAFVGTCSPGSTVDVGAGAKVGDCGHPIGASSGDAVMRACSGLVACDRTSANHLASANNTCGSKPAVKFICPSSGKFNVMMAAAIPGALYKAKPKAKGGGSAFPLFVEELFKLKEGAFYGNIFNPEKLNPNVTIIPAEGDRKQPILRIRKGDEKHSGLGHPVVVLYEDAAVCHDPDWTEGDAYMHARNCAIATVQDESGALAQANLCVALPLGECSKSGVLADDPAARCQVFDGYVELGDFDYDDCLDQVGNVRRFPITSYLDDPCSVVGGPSDPNGKDPTGKPTDGKKDLCGRK